MEVITIDPFALTDLDTARAYLKAETTNYDELIKACVNRASAQIEMYCKRFMYKRLYDTSSGNPGDRPTMRLSGDGKNNIMVKEYPIITVLSILERYPDGVNTRTLNLTGMQFRTGHVIHLPFDSFSKGFDNIEVKGVFGYDQNIHFRERRAIEAACLRWVQVMYQDQSAAIGRGTTFGVGGDTVQLISGAMPPDIMQAIAPYQRYV